MTIFLQLMDQLITQSFKKFYIKKIFTMCYEITEAEKNMKLREFWKILLKFWTVCNWS